ncbi:MAG: thermonuclease family protein [Burkholderiaceae bacterium]
MVSSLPDAITRTELHTKMKIFIGLLLSISATAHGAQVIEVRSGDTLSLTEQGKTVTIRLANVDAPELDQPYGAESRRSLEEMCKGKEASYQPQGASLKGELRAAVICGEIDVGRAQLKRGLAWVRPHPDVDAAFTAIQDFVWREKTGLWADANPVPPWEWAERKR